MEEVGLDLKLPEWKRSAYLAWTSSYQNGGGWHARFSHNTAKWNTSDLDFDWYVWLDPGRYTTPALSQASEVKRLNFDQNVSDWIQDSTHIKPSILMHFHITIKCLSKFTIHLSHVRLLLTQHIFTWLYFWKNYVLKLASWDLHLSYYSLWIRTTMRITSQYFIISSSRMTE